MGDLFFNGRFPFIDLANGGTVDGFIDDIDRALALVAADTKVIPGHGALSNVVELAEAADLVRDAREKVRQAASAGELDALIKAGFGGRTSGWDNHERLIETLRTSDESRATPGGRR